MARIFCFLCLMLLVLVSGCGHVRVSGKYGDCAPYVRTKEQVYRKFYIRSLNVYNWPGKNFLLGAKTIILRGRRYLLPQIRFANTLMICLLWSLSMMIFLLMS